MIDIGIFKKLIIDILEPFASASNAVNITITYTSSALEPAITI